MSSITNRVDSFLRENGMHPDCIDIRASMEDFMLEMEQGLSGDGSSLMMFPTYVNIEGEIPDDRPVIVMDAGGTNFRVALVSFRYGKPEIESQYVYPMPGSDFGITKGEFLQRVVHYLTPVLNKSDKVGFCFSYPAEILPNRDGKLVAFNKEVRIAESEGMEICAEISNALKENGFFAEKKYVLINDTVATLLGGLAETKGKEYDGYLGFILGTGTNTCYIEQTSHIKRYQMEGQPKRMIINMEAGGYANFPQGRFDKALDTRSTNSGEHLYEKMISGAYQGSRILMSAATAAQRKIFSDNFAERVTKLADASMEDVDEFCREPLGNGVLASLCACEEDVEALYHIVDMSIERAAKLVCVNLAAVLEKTDSGKKPYRPACIVAEGSGFYKALLFRPKLMWYVRSFINGELGRYCEFVQANNTNLVGAATAALLNL